MTNNNELLTHSENLPNQLIEKIRCLTSINNTSGTWTCFGVQRFKSLGNR